LCLLHTAELAAAYCGTRNTRPGSLCQPKIEGLQSPDIAAAWAGGHLQARSSITCHHLNGEPQRPDRSVNSKRNASRHSYTTSLRALALTDELITLALQRTTKTTSIGTPTHWSMSRFSMPTPMVLPYELCFRTEMYRSWFMRCTALGQRCIALESCLLLVDKSVQYTNADGTTT
jgi:hypothetical protein